MILELKQYVMDAFTEKVFSGNPAAVCILDRVLISGTAALFSEAAIHVPVEE